MRNLVLFDIDGVLADDSHRVKHALGKNWGMYFDPITMLRDTPLADGLSLVREFYSKNATHEVQYLTGRRIDRYDTTRQWLALHGFPNAERITMRGFAHKDILAKYKAGVIRTAIEGGRFTSVHLFEDDPEVVRHVNEQFGEGSATLTTWYVKNTEMVKLATA